MAILISDPKFQRRLIRKRRETGADRFDEVWDGVYVVSPLANIEHQDIPGSLYLAIRASIGQNGRNLVLPGTNVSDREVDWRKNYRCPDVAVFLDGTNAQNRDSHWFGGPDFAVEVMSPYDRSRKKLGFYASIGTRELLLVDRKPWALELYRLQEGALILVGKSSLEQPDRLASEVLPLTFRLMASEPRPMIEIAHTDGIQRWSA